MASATNVMDLHGFAGTAILWKLQPPMDTRQGETEYVITSAAVVRFTGPETYIFPATDSGEVTDWVELSGSYRGGFDHKEALRRAGYDEFLFVQ